MADFDDIEWPSFQLDSVVLRWHGGDLGFGDLAGEQPVPHGVSHGDISVHLIDGAGSGDDLSVETVGEHARGEPVVAVSMGDENVSEVLVAGLHPLAHSVRLLASERWVDQNGITVTVNQGGRQW